MTYLLRPRVLGVALCISVVVALASWTQSAPQTAASGLLNNPGFESGVLNGSPTGWTVAQPVPDAVTVVGAEGPSQFPTYGDMGNVTVAPYRGNLMLRLGTPKRVAEAQTRGLNSVSQAFTSSLPSVQFSFRLFSWEPRGSDLFRFDLTSSAGSVGSLNQPLVVTMADGATRTCTGIPCQFNIDAGKKGQYLDSGWRAVRIVNVPTGVPLTLTYGVGGTDDSAHATWAYFDNVNTPPVAKFSFSPSDPLEGSFIQLHDLSYDPDPEDKIIGWKWNVAGDPSDAQNPFTVLPNEGTYNVSLTVTSTDGTSTTVASGQTAIDGSVIPPLIVSNAPPVADALNVETLASQSVPLAARFADPGWNDTHTMSWSVGGTSVNGTLAEDHLPALSTGLSTASVNVGASTPCTSGAPCTFTITDNAGASTSDSFGVSVVPDDPQRFEPNDVLANAPVLTSGGSYLSYIQSAGDVDVFEVLLPGNKPLPPGSEVLLSLRGLPADFDLVALTEAPAGPQTSRFAASDFGQVGFSGARFAASRFAASRFASSRFAASRFAASRFAASPFTFANVPLSGVSFTDLNGEQIGGTDISLEELGLGSIGGTNVQVAGFSANRGLDDETVLARTSAAGTRVFAAIAGSNGARSASPYRLQVEASVPFDLTTALGSAACTATPLVSAAQAGAGYGSTQVLYHTAGARTLFVTQRERMRNLNNMDDAAWNAMQADLVALAQQPSVLGEIISMPSGIYDQWDTHPCDIAAADGVAESIRSIIQSRLSGVENVVVIGDDDIIPYKRVPDETIISNERDYALDSFLKAGSPELASILLGYNLSDDYYVDAAPTSWQGRSLYVPDLPIGRLVETPAQIRAAARVFVASNGVLNPTTGFVSGYDFFKDGSQATAANLSSKLSTTTLINDTWTADDLRCRLLGQVLGSVGGCSVPGVAAVNAHFTHYAALAAGGFTSGNFNDVLTSTDVANAGGGNPALGGRIVFSMGCHAGLSVPNRSSLGADAGLNLDPSLDFAEAMAIQRAVYVASTGFGLGDDEGIGGTEKLMALYSEELTKGDVAAGGALVSAKQRYVGGLSAMTVYDEKSTIQTVFYGLPMYRVQTAGPAPAPAQASVAASSVNLTVSDGGGSSVTSAALARVDGAAGSYFTADGDAQGTAGRAIEPRVVRPIAPAAAGPVHGVLLTGGTFTDSSPFDPVITRPTNEWEAAASEPGTCLPSFWPADLASVKTLETAGSLRQTLVVTPGQFQCTSGAAPTVTGLQRLYQSLAVQLLRCQSADTEPPDIHAIDLRTVSTGVTLTIDVSDTSGLTRIVVLRIGGGVVTPTSVDIPGVLAGKFSIDVPTVSDADDLIVQVQDGACNVATATAKGANISPIRADAGPDQVLATPGANLLAVRIQNFASRPSPVFALWDFGDGSYYSKAITSSDVTTDAAGTATLTVPHVYSTGIATPILASVKITDGFGGLGGDDILIHCDSVGETGDPGSDLIDCGTSNDATSLTLTMSTTGPISSRVQYRVTLQVGSNQIALRYDGGKVLGPPSLSAVVSGNQLRLRVTLADIGAVSGTPVQWFVETQSGVKGEAGAGFPDRMPDAGFITYTVH